MTDDSYKKKDTSWLRIVIAAFKVVFQQRNMIRERIIKIALKKALPYLVIGFLVFVGLIALFTFLFVQVFA
ncbi:MAG: hypothetical protein F4X82_03590 [Candidatus Spechtbacteria bacterium SB0662_bin_43]|uniref:DUF2970 domain-containing protein n=1 Tax=Candidatus Spechtbacteria bacterium SB0662_bin_43 TaxID=2604897 RepID=A0A845DEW8_9BACT|nr:hypothetical protein [Candidatus Spechtbacteria bacterium SB0662_bin_43]